MAPLNSVLLVDDSASDNELHSLMIMRARAVDSPDAIFVARDGVEGLEFLQDPDAPRRLGDRFPPRLILVDINMPRMDGFTFVKRAAPLISAGRLDVKIVMMLTSSASPEEKTLAETLPVVRAYMQKPLTRSAVEALVEEYFSDQ